MVCAGLLLHDVRREYNEALAVFDRAIEAANEAEDTLVHHLVKAQREAAIVGGGLRVCMHVVRARCLTRSPAVNTARRQAHLKTCPPRTSGAHPRLIRLAR